MKKSIVMFIKKEFPYVVGVNLKEQLDLDKKPLFCVFLKEESKTERIYVF